MLLESCGVATWLVFRLEIAAAGLLCALMTWFIIRMLPADFLRVLLVSAVRSIYHLRTVNPDRLPARGGVLLLPNHVTWADSFFIGAACGRPIRFVMDETFMARPAVRWFVGLFDTVTIRRDQPREAIRIVIDGLRAGDVMCLFPEGQLTRTGNLCQLERGFELIARKAGHPLVPLWCDGSWGSIFSFERGRFFRKWPYRLFRYGIRAAFGEPLAPETVTLPRLRNALAQAAGEAYESRFRANTWAHRVPRDDRERWNAMAAESRRRCWLNGYQIGQVQALQRRRTFHLLAADAGTAGIPSPLHAFASLFKARAASHPSWVANGGSWVGGDGLRASLETAAIEGTLTFYDFSNRALEPLVRPGVLHCPCLAIDGLVVAMSMPNPPAPSYPKEDQAGLKSGTWGRLLPGWFAVPDPAGRLRVHGPAAPAEGLLLPAGSVVDGEDFVSPAPAGS